MAVFALVIEIFACGAFLLLVGTDAVEPWSAPDSLKIEENEEIHVSEFRTEQLIIRSTHPSYTGYQRYPDGKWIPFGPIFHLELLNQVIASITRCIAPIYSYLVPLAAYDHEWHASFVGYTTLYLCCCKYI